MERVMTSRLLSVIFAWLSLRSAWGQTLNPCNPEQPTGVQKGKGFVIGLAYWPGGTPAMWGNASFGLHPCYDNATKLARVGMTVASFSIKVDTMTVLRTSRRDEANLFDRPYNVPGSSGPAKVMSVIAFAGKYRSEARYIWSNEADLTTGVGVVDSLALLVNFDKGSLKSLKWQDLGCSDCSKDSCVVTNDFASSCAYNSTASCACSQANNTATIACANPVNIPPSSCHTGIQVAVTGSDKNSATFASGAQLQKISGLSLSNLYKNTKLSLGSAFVDIKQNATGNVFGQ